MLALEVRLNGELKATCGSETAEWLAAGLTARRVEPGMPKDFALGIECAGRLPVDADTFEVVKWVSARLKLGDEISFRFVEAASAQDPIDRQKVSKRDDSPDA